MRSTSLRFIIVALFALAGATIAPAQVTPLPDDPACTPVDRKFMLRANELAAAASARGNGAYGALLVKDGKVLGEFSNCVLTSGDPTQHAETGLLAMLSRQLGHDALVGSVLYTSTEPCIMCCGSIRAAGIREFVYGATATQVTRLRGGKVPEKPLQCREIFLRITPLTPCVIRGPLMEAEGLAVHAVHFAALPR